VTLSSAAPVLVLLLLLLVGAGLLVLAAGRLDLRRSVEDSRLEVPIQLAHLLLGLLALRDVAEVRDDAPNAGVVEQVRDRALREDPLTILAPT